MDAVYGGWMRDVHPPPVPAIQKLEGINLADAALKKDVYDLLRKSIGVVVFWLTSCVFPNESMQFSGVLRASSQQR